MGSVIVNIKSPLHLILTSWHISQVCSSRGTLRTRCVGVSLLYLCWCWYVIQARRRTTPTRPSVKINWRRAGLIRPQTGVRPPVTRCQSILPSLCPAQRSIRHVMKMLLAGSLLSPGLEMFSPLMSGDWEDLCADNGLKWSSQLVVTSASF